MKNNKGYKDLQTEWSEHLVEAFNQGLKEDVAEERLEKVMEEYFGGISYRELRRLAEENFPEKFI